MISRASEELDRALRVAFFRDSRNISMRHVIAEVASSCDEVDEDKLIDALEILALDGHKPDLTLVLDMDPDAALARVAQRAMDDGSPIGPDRFEREGLDWHRRLREAFLAIARNNAERCVIIAADSSEDVLEIAVWEAVKRRFPELDAERPA